MTMLPSDSLSGLTVALSASGSADLPRLGLLDDHLRLALGEIARSVVTLGGTLQYCGHLAPEGYTAFLVDEVKRYSRRDAPLSVILAWNVHRRVPIMVLRDVEQDLGLLGTIQYLDPEGGLIEKEYERGEAPAEIDPDEEAASLTAMRVFAASAAQARVLVGGKRHGYRGSMPGVLEEAILALERSRPLFLAGGYGGAAADVIRVIEPEALYWLPALDPDIEDVGHARALEHVAMLVEGSGWDALTNGLEPDENRHLAATHRASEVAALVSVGLGRLQSASRD